MNDFKEYAKYSNLILTMIVMVAIGVFGGIKLDNYFGVRIPFFTICLTILSTAAALFHLFKTLLKK